MSKEKEAEKPSSKMLIQLISENRVVEARNQDKLKQILNIEPPSQWIMDHPFAKGVAYLPIDKVEILLDTIFQEWRPEIKSVTQLAQSIVCVARVHYRNPVTGEWSYADGVGAVPLKTDKGYSAADLAHIKSDAVQTGAPSAMSFAIKDAAEHLGKIFGRDLNRKNTVDFYGVYANNIDIKPTETGHGKGVDMRYARLRSKTSNIRLVDAIEETRTMDEAKVLEKIKEMEAEEEAKAEISAEVKEESAAEYRNTQQERFVERMAGY